MHTKSLTLTEQPVDSKEFKSYDIGNLPKLIIGFNIKNKYDQQRLRYKTKYQPKNILHFISRHGHPELEPVYLHGIELTLTEKVKHVISLIDNAQPITLHGYKNILKYNKLACDTCYGHMADGIYPIDIDYLDDVCDEYNTNDYNRLRNMLEPSEDLPWFSSWSSFKIFILLPSLIY
mgnify:FL=1|jgi:hypothetical protein